MGRGNNLLTGPRRKLQKAVAPVRGPIKHQETKGITVWRRQSDQLPDREDGPAVIIKDGSFWTVVADHQIYGPAKIYYRSGQLHRTDGPAIEYANGTKEWWVRGQRDREGGPAITSTNGDEFWYKDNQLHRENGPAVKLADGRREWFVNNQRHRQDGPAVEKANGDKIWWVNDRVHREDGPAIEEANGRKKWFLNGKEYSEDKWQEELKKRGMK